MTTTTTTPLSVNLDGEDYENRLYGCWKGKNAGGTLGTPIETAWGQEEPFDIWWYPELQEGGLPNDDLEMQLVWLKALEEVGPGITARDLSRYWLDHIGYNFDEYGLSKLNLRWGLEPPLSGHHNNWFIDCMGSPIRSEIWACVAPGQPRIAAHYAFQDAICDHAGGEGVFGELFNAALESAAFVVQEPKLLIDIALSYVPHDSMVRKAVLAAVAAFDAGVDWKDEGEIINRVGTGTGPFLSDPITPVSELPELVERVVAYAAVPDGHTSLQAVTQVPTYFTATYGLDVPRIFAALVLMCAPIVTAYLAFQSFFEKGLTAGALK